MSTTTELERLIIRLVGDSSNYQRMLEQAKVQTEQTAQRLTRIGTRLTTAITLPLSIMGGLSVRAFSQFDQAMTESTSIMQVTEEQIVRMRETALTLSTQGARGPAELARAYFYLASAGKNAEQSMSLLPSLTRFATAGAFDLALATDLLTDAQSALGLAVSDVAEDTRNLARVSDVLVQANTISNATVQQFSEALTNGAGAALRSVNKDMEEGVAVLAAYAATGAAKGMPAGSMLARMMLLLSQSSREAADAHERLGFQVYDSSGKMRNLADIIENLEQITAGMSDQAKAATLDQLGFAARVQQAILPVLGMSSAIRGFEQRLRQASGVTDEVANRQMRSFSNQIKIVKNQVTVLAIEIGEILAPAVKMLADIVSFGITQFRALSPTLKSAVVAVSGLAAALGPGATALGFLMRNLAGIRTAMTGVLALIPGWGWVAAAIIGVVTAVFGFEDSLNSVASTARTVWSSITNYAMAFWNWFQPIWNQMYRTASTALMGIRTVFITLYNSVLPLIQDLGRQILEIWDWITGGTVLDIETIQTSIISMLRAAEYGMLNFDRVAQFVWTGLLHQVATFSNDVGYFFTQYLPTAFSNWSTVTIDIFANTFRYVSVVISDFLNGTTTAFEMMWTDLLQPPARQLSDMERELRDSFVEQGNALTDGYREFSRQLDLTPAQREIDSATRTAEENGRQIGSALNDGVNSVVSETFEAVASNSAAAMQRIQQSRQVAREQAQEQSNPLQNLVNRLGGSIQNLGNLGEQAHQRIGNAGVGMFDRVGMSGAGLMSQWEFSWQALVDRVGELWAATISGFQTPFENLYNNMYNISSDFWMSAGNLQDAFWQGQTAQWDMFWGVAEEFWPGIGEQAQGFWDEALLYAQATWETIQEGFMQVIEFLATPLGGLENVQAAGSFIGEALNPSNALQAVGNLFSPSNEPPQPVENTPQQSQPLSNEAALQVLTNMVSLLQTIADQPSVQVQEVALE